MCNGFRTISDERFDNPKLLSPNASVVTDAPHSKNAGRFGTSCGARPIQLFEGSRPWVQQTLWNLNRFWTQKPCQTGRLAKRLLLILIELLLLATICVILPPAPSVLQEGRSTLASIHAKASAAKRLRSNAHLGSKRLACARRRRVWRFPKNQPFLTIEYIGLNRYAV